MQELLCLFVLENLHKLYSATSMHHRSLNYRYSTHVHFQYLHTIASPNNGLATIMLPMHRWFTYFNVQLEKCKCVVMYIVCIIFLNNLITLKFWLTKIFSKTKLIWFILLLGYTIFLWMFCSISVFDKNDS